MAAYHLHRSVLRAIFRATIIAAAWANVSFAIEPPVLNAEQIGRLAVFAPKPVYPLAARRQHQMGRGVFLLNVNAKTGQVKSIKIEKGTGSETLDVACLKAFITWRFKPNTVTKAHVPVTFLMGGYRKTELDQLFP